MRVWCLWRGVHRVLQKLPHQLSRSGLGSRVHRLCRWCWLWLTRVPQTCVCGGSQACSCVHAKERVHFTSLQAGTRAHTVMTSWGMRGQAARVGPGAPSPDRCHGHAPVHAACERAQSGVDVDLWENVPPSRALAVCAVSTRARSEMHNTRRQSGPQGPLISDGA